MKSTINKVQCKHCKDTIESKHENDFKRCECGRVYISGGIEDPRVGYTTNPSNDYIELSE